MMLRRGRLFDVGPLDATTTMRRAMYDVVIVVASMPVRCYYYLLTSILTPWSSCLVLLTTLGLSLTTTRGQKTRRAISKK